jgi:hypothetical protein
MIRGFEWGLTVAVVLLATLYCHKSKRGEE